MKKNLYVKLGAMAGTVLMTAAPGNAHTGGIRSGPYIGASVGLSHLSGGQNLNAINIVPPAPATTTVSHSLRLSADSVGASVFGGYGYKWNCTWLAAELSYLFDQMESRQGVNSGNNTVNGVLKARSTGAFGGALHLGYIAHDNCVIYVIAGVEMRRFRMSFQDNSPDNTIVSKNNKSYTSTAFVPGIGTSIKLTKNVSVRAEYKYAIHPTRSTSASAANAALGGTDTSTIKQSPRVQTFHLGLVYSF